MATFVSGLATSDPPRFPGEDLVAAFLAGAVLAASCALVNRAGDRSARNDLLFVAGFAAFVVLLSVDSTGAIPLLAPLPALLVGYCSPWPPCAGVSCYALPVSHWGPCML